MASQPHSVRRRFGSLGRWSHVQAQFRSNPTESCFDRSLAIQDLQSAWLLLLFCANPQAIFAHPQRAVACRSAQWMGAVHQGPASEVGSVASGDEGSQNKAEQARKRVGQLQCIGPHQSSTSSTKRVLRRQEGSPPSKSRGASPVHRAILGLCEEEVGGGGEGSGGHKKAILSGPKWFLRRRGSPS